jgi:hypothetical protein
MLVSLFIEIIQENTHFSWIMTSFTAMNWIVQLTLILMFLIMWRLLRSRWGIRRRKSSKCVPSSSHPDDYGNKYAKLFICITFKYEQGKEEEKGLHLRHISDYLSRSSYSSDWYSPLPFSFFPFSLSPYFLLCIWHSKPLFKIKINYPTKWRCSEPSSK